MSKSRSHLVDLTVPLLLALGAALSSAGCIRFTYDETTPLPASLSATSTPTPIPVEQPPSATPTTQPPTACPSPSPTPTHAVTATSTPAVEGQGRYHVVQPGETLYSIGLRYGMTVEDLAAANNLLDPAALQVGQRLLIPSPTVEGHSYTVQPGDTLYAIAQRFGTSVIALAALNDIAPPYTIQVGQTLILPQ
jgi:LysM repeat protein